MPAGYCFCQDAPNVEVDIRQQLQKVIFDLCPRGEMNRCLCEDNSKILFPFNALELISCYPKKVMYYDLKRFRTCVFVVSNIYQGWMSPKVQYYVLWSYFEKGPRTRTRGTFYIGSQLYLPHSVIHTCSANAMEATNRGR